MAIDRSNYAKNTGSGYVKLPDRLAGMSASSDVKLKSYTTTQKNALTLGTGGAGTLVFDSTLGKACVWTGSAWQTITSA